MSIVTLCTDLGLKDYYLSTVKATLLKECEGVDIIDISHHVGAFDLAGGAFQIRNAWPEFPPGTVHVVCVDSLVSKDTRYLALKHQDHYFLSADNGIFSLMFDEVPRSAFQIEANQNGQSIKFPLRDILVKAAARLVKGDNLESLGREVTDLKIMTNLQPVITENAIKASVIHVDHYENVILNLNQELFERVSQNREMVLNFSRTDYIDKIESNYYDVQEGEKICFFNASGFLEIAINKGKASSLLGLKLGDLVQIDFE